MKAGKAVSRRWSVVSIWVFNVRAGYIRVIKSQQPRTLSNLRATTYADLMRDVFSICYEMPFAFVWIFKIFDDNLFIKCVLWRFIVSFVLKFYSLLVGFKTFIRQSWGFVHNDKLQLCIDVLLLFLARIV